MKIAIYPGSFDPVTSGHLNIIRRAANIFDRLIVCVMVNSGKRPMFSKEERVDLIRKVTADIPNVEVDASDELLAEYARRKGSCVIVKGLRAGSDFENEFQMAMINRKINPEKMEPQPPILRSHLKENREKNKKKREVRRESRRMSKKK